MQDYLIHTKDAFNKIADSYDEEDYSNEILRWMRGNMYEIYLSFFKSGDRLLELNSGTGIDAITLASNGIKVFATDISENMIYKLREKVELQKLNHLINAENFSFDELENINENNFDGVISNFGGLNCINDFSNLSKTLYKKIKAGGKFISAVMNTYCPWEILYFLLKSDPKNAFRRFDKDGIDANLSQFKIKSFYFTPKEFAFRFEKHFEIEKVYSMGLLTPPPYLFGIYKRFKPVIKLFMGIDNITKGIFPFNRIGDHFVIVLKRRHENFE